jgi:hypothetical protein
MSEQTKVIKTITQPVNQSFDIKLNGLNIGTALSIYYDNLLVQPRDIEPRNGKVGDPLVTDNNGSARFIFYVRESYQDLIDKPEADFISTLNKEIGDKKLVAVDRASISTASLPSDYRSIARCYAEITVSKSFEIVFSDFKNFSGSKENAGSRRLTII